MTESAFFDNRASIVKDDLVARIRKGDRVSVASSVFSLYAYQELKEQLAQVEEFRFLFTAQAFTRERAPKEKREFYIPRLNRERGLYGTEFDIRLRNELSQKAIATECANWIRAKAVFKSFRTEGGMGATFLAVDAEGAPAAYLPFNGFTTGDAVKCTIDRMSSDMNDVLTCFSPVSKERDAVVPRLAGCDIDIVIATDCISEGQNLQDCDWVINYDIRWNPVRIVQRFGRVERIGSKNASIQLVNYWPDVELDEYIKLVVRVELRQREVPCAVLRFVAEHNSHKLVFACVYGDDVCLAVMLKKLVVGAWQPGESLALDLRSDNMDAFWDSLASQVAYGDTGLGAGAAVSFHASVLTAEERFARDQRIAALRDEIARVDARCRKEKQINRKNELFARARNLRAKLAELES